ncbi:hypothetical protein BLA17378_07011 [Burkholderia aenigmatica]|uniref:Uncharacterized protein n=1 Tax=Burkholderia aenigmatica TaxID=2015348 RepID=A0ABY6Y2V8_9BURK|nr:hypothetical protein BLA17378_07011 [Burkholderia aenigmatica]VWD57566.1 hypothetical protein BLA18628_06789 [Burkholderia aenigmatica]
MFVAAERCRSGYPHRQRPYKAAQGRRPGRAPTLTVEMHSGSSPFQGGISTPWRTPRSIGHSPSPWKYTVLRVFSGVRYPHLGEPFGQSRDDTHLRNAQRFESLPGQDIHTLANASFDPAIARAFETRSTSGPDQGRIFTPRRVAQPIPRSHSPRNTRRFASVQTQNIHTAASASAASSITLTLEIHSASSPFGGRISTPQRTPRSIRRAYRSSPSTARRVACGDRILHRNGLPIHIDARQSPLSSTVFRVLPGVGCPQQRRCIRPLSTILTDAIHRVSRRSGHDRYAARARNLAADRAPHPVAPTPLNVRRQSSVASPPASFDSYPAGRRARFPSIRSRR